MPTNRRPFPFDAILNGVGVMLADTGTPQDPSLAWEDKRVEDLNPPVRLTESDLTYAQYPPAVEYPYAVTDLSGGFGLAEQDPKQRDRYWYAEYVDCSSGWGVVGPRVQTVGSTASAGITSFVEYNSILYFGAGQYLYKYSSGNPGSMTQVHDFGAGKTVGQMCVFQGSQSAAYLFIPIGAATNYYTMDTTETFVQHGSRAATNFETIGDELWLASVESNLAVIRKSTDGGTAATWQSATTIGDALYSINWLRAVVDRLFCLKPNGVYAPTVNGPTTLVDEDIAPHLRQFVLSSNGVGAVDWNGELVFKHGHALYGYQPLDGSFRQFGPEIIEGHRTNIATEVVAVAVQTGMALYAGTYDGTDSYLLKYGSWKLVDTESGPKREFKSSWHAFLYKWASKQITSMFISYLFDSGQPRLMVGLADGTLSWCKLPKTVLSRDDPGVQYNSTDTPYVYYPRFTSNLPVENKLLRALGLFGRELTTLRNLTGQFKIPSDVAYTDAGASPAVISDPGARQALVTPISSKAFDTRVKIGFSGNNTACILTAFTVYSAVQSTPLREIRCVVQDVDGMVDRTGKPIPMKSARQMHAAMETVGTSTTGVTIITPDGTTLTVIGLGYSHRMLGWDKNGNPRMESSVHMVTTA